MPEPYRPGQAVSLPRLDERIQRIERLLEGKGQPTQRIGPNALDIKALIGKLEATWNPDANTFLAPGTVSRSLVTADLLPVSTAYISVLDGISAGPGGVFRKGMSATDREIKLRDPLTTRALVLVQFTGASNAAASSETFDVQLRDSSDSYIWASTTVGLKFTTAERATLPFAAMVVEPADHPGSMIPEVSAASANAALDSADFITYFALQEV